MLIIHAQLSCIRLTDFTMSNLCFNRIHTNVNSCCCGNGLPDSPRFEVKEGQSIKQK